jgi:hypothetical protein
MKVIVATNPQHDVPTKHLSYWVKTIIDQVASLQEVEIVILEGKEAVRGNFLAAVGREDPRLILLNGHGNYSTVCGYQDGMLISVTNNDLDKFNDKIVHSLSCSSAKELGKKMIQIGTKTFIGYSEPFQFWINDANPLSSTSPDTIASLFLEPAYEVVKELCKGSDSLTAFQISQELYRKNLLMISTSSGGTSSTDRSMLAAALYHDLKYQVLLGDRAATF